MSFALTRLFPKGTQNRLKDQVGIVNPNTNVGVKINAVWDTGATLTVITQAIFNALRLSVSGQTLSQSTNLEAEIKNICLIKIEFPEGHLTNIEAVIIDSVDSECDALIGMNLGLKLKNK